MHRLLLAALALLPGASHAVQKCVAPDGSVSYVDVCPTGQTRAPSKTDKPVHRPAGTLPRKSAEPPKPAPARSDVRLQYYDVDAPSFAQARNATTARADGPVQAGWQMSYEYKVRQSAGRCSLGTIATKLDLVVTLPRWKAPEGTPEEELELWKHYVEALRLAEDPRLEHARAFERALPPQLYALPAAQSCAAFEAAMKSRFEALRTETQARFSDQR
ncbi:MAG TPA: DUF922 domain-containing protein [Burkholderiales bacterium]|nr:DUF922 domain-containing protein [Burkholderiales bacterium]